MKVLGHKTSVNSEIRWSSQFTVSLVSTVSIFCAFCLDSEKCPNIEFFWSVFSRIQTEYGPEKTPYLDTFHAVFCLGS